MIPTPTHGIRVVRYAMDAQSARIGPIGAAINVPTVTNTDRHSSDRSSIC